VTLPVRVPVAKQERDAWNLYLVECTRIPEHDYDALEPDAWRRLKRRLREITTHAEYEA
jgi:hypothetical protein